MPWTRTRAVLNKLRTELCRGPLFQTKRRATRTGGTLTPTRFLGRSQMSQPGWLQLRQPIGLLCQMLRVAHLIGGMKRLTRCDGRSSMRPLQRRVHPRRLRRPSRRRRRSHNHLPRSRLLRSRLPRSSLPNSHLLHQRWQIPHRLYRQPLLSASRSAGSRRRLPSRARLPPSPCRHLQPGRRRCRRAGRSSAIRRAPSSFATLARGRWHGRTQA